MHEQRHGRPLEQAFQHADNAGHAGSLDASGGVDEIGSRRGARSAGPRESRCGPRSAGGRSVEDAAEAPAGRPRGQFFSWWGGGGPPKKEKRGGRPRSARGRGGPPFSPNEQAENPGASV